MTGELSGQVAVVTGGSRGIGRATAVLLAAAGAKVVITGLHAATGHGVVSAIRSGGGEARFIAADQGSNEDWSRVIDETLGAYGRLDILVANAGCLSAAPAAEMTLDMFRELNRVMLKGSFLGLKHAVGAMRRHGEGGAIVLIASIAGLVGSPESLHYTAAKGGIRLLAKAAALELGPEKIRVNSLHPGFIRTDMNASFDRALIAQDIPLGRFGEPEEIARVALYLVSPRGKFVTGAQLVVDGGYVVQ